MTTPEQQAAERDALKAELAAINGAGEPVAWIVRKVDWSERMSDVIRGSNPPAWADVAHPLYTRPATPLTDEQIDELAVKHQHFVTTSDGQTHEQFEIFDFARAIEAHIKGAKP